MLEGYSIAREVTKVTLDCTHHDCRRMSPGVVAQILGDKLEMGPSVLGRHILCYQLAGRQPGTGPGLSVEPSARPGRLERDLIDQPEGPPRDVVLILGVSRFITIYRLLLGVLWGLVATVISSLGGAWAGRSIGSSRSVSLGCGRCAF